MANSFQSNTDIPVMFFCAFICTSRHILIFIMFVFIARAVKIFLTSTRADMTERAFVTHLFFLKCLLSAFVLLPGMPSA